MVYIPMIETPDGECQIWIEPPITWVLQRAYYSHINSRLWLMDYIADKYWHGSLEMMCRMKGEIRRAYQTQIGKILNGYSEGEIW